MLLRPDPELDRRIAEEDSQERAEMLVRIDRIEARYQRINRYFKEEVERLLRAAAVARESIAGGDEIWKNRGRFNHLIVRSEDLTHLLEVAHHTDLRLRSAQARWKRQDKGVLTRQRVLEAVKRIRAQYPAMLYRPLCLKVVDELKREGFERSVDRVQFYYPRKNHPVGK